MFRCVINSCSTFHLGPGQQQQQQQQDLDTISSPETIRPGGDQSMRQVDVRVLFVEDAGCHAEQFARLPDQHRRLGADLQVKQLN